MRKHIFILFLLFPLVSLGQSFLQQQEVIFRAAESQWMCKELEIVNSQYFECTPSNASWKIPQGESLSFLNIEVAINDSDKTGFTSLLFPNNECMRYLKIVSLCDLYFPLFRKKAESAGLPSDYQYLPVVLSGLNMSARNNENRSGLWAMDYLVARKYGLRIDQYVDERNGGDFTTDAAIKCLADLHKRFDGDHLKVITAYRKGIPYVVNLIEEAEGAVFFDMLDEDSKHFVKLLAYVKSVIVSTRAENQLSNYFDIMGNYEGVFVEENTMIEALSNVLQIEERILRQTNPVYVGSYLESSYRKIPFLIDNTKTAKYHILKDSISNWSPQVTIAPVVKTEKNYHTVKKGESLGTIARKNRVTVSQIKKWNSLRSDNIRAGQRLVVGQGGTATPKPSTLVAEKKPEIPKDSPKSTDIVKPKEKKPSTAAKEDKSGKITYTVKSGDSLWKIAQRYKGVTENDLKKWNNTGSNIRPGQKLVIYTK